VVKFEATPGFKPDELPAENRQFAFITVIGDRLFVKIF